MAAAADDDDVIGRLRLRRPPLPAPALMGVEGLGDQRLQRKSAHGHLSTVEDCRAAARALLRVRRILAVFGHCFASPRLPTAFTHLSEGRGFASPRLRERVRPSAERAERSGAGVRGRRRIRRPAEAPAPPSSPPPHPRLLRRLAAFGGPLPASGERRGERPFRRHHDSASSRRRHASSPAGRPKRRRSGCSAKRRT